MLMFNLGKIAGASYYSCNFSVKLKFFQNRESNIFPSFWLVNNSLRIIQSLKITYALQSFSCSLKVGSVSQWPGLTLLPYSAHS